MTSITASLDPSTRFALAYLRRHLTDEGTFSTNAIGRIIDHVRTEGTVDGAPFVRPDEVDPLTEVYISAFPAIDYSDPAWGEPDEDPRWTDNRLCPCGRTTEASPCKCEPALAPIAGGSDDDIPPSYEPTPADWADYDLWCATADYLDRFNRARDDASEIPA